MASILLTTYACKPALTGAWSFVGMPRMDAAALDTNQPRGS